MKHSIEESDFVQTYFKANTRSITKLTKGMSNQKYGKMDMAMRTTYRDTLTHTTVEYTRQEHFQPRSLLQQYFGLFNDRLAQRWSFIHNKLLIP